MPLRTLLRPGYLFKRAFGRREKDAERPEIRYDAERRNEGDVLDNCLLWLGREHPHLAGPLSLLGSHLSRLRIPIAAADDQHFVIGRESK
jgi:hypothetical protein